MKQRRLAQRPVQGGVEEERESQQVTPASDSGARPTGSGPAPTSILRIPGMHTLLFMRSESTRGTSGLTNQRIIASSLFDMQYELSIQRR